MSYNKNNKGKNQKRKTKNVSNFDIITDDNTNKENESEDNKLDIQNVNRGKIEAEAEGIRLDQDSEVDKIFRENNDVDKLKNLILIF